MQGNRDGSWWICSSTQATGAYSNFSSHQPIRYNFQTQQQNLSFSRPHFGAGGNVEVIGVDNAVNKTRKNRLLLLERTSLRLGFDAFERLIRAFRSSIRTVKVLKVAAYPGKVLTLQMSKPKNFKYMSGQYMFVNCPAVSPFEWYAKNTLNNYESTTLNPFQDI